MIQSNHACEIIRTLVGPPSAAHMEENGEEVIVWYVGEWTIKLKTEGDGSFVVQVTKGEGWVGAWYFWQDQVKLVRLVTLATI